MTQELRLGWEPTNRTPLTSIEERFRSYMKGRQSGVSLLNNGTLIFSANGRDDLSDAQTAMDEAKFLMDFQVDLLKEGGFLVTFHDAVAVFVGDEEFRGQRDEILRRLSELKFPEEEMFGKQAAYEGHLLVGLYARGKLQRDAHHFGFYKRICGDG